MSVWLCSKPCETSIVNVHPEWVDAIDKHVDPKIVFQIVNQVRLVKIVLDDEATLGRTVFNNLLTITR